MRILVLASHAVAEYDDIRMFHDLGYEVFCPGGYEDPSSGTEGIRPPLPQVPYYADLAERCQRQRNAYGDPGTLYDWAKARLHDDVIDWADVIIAHHYVDRWIAKQWGRIGHKRVIWRTCGQSSLELERVMGTLRGLQVVRYSPAERRFFEPRGSFAGEDAIIRFGKYPSDYGPWTGEAQTVGNLTQDLVERDDACGFGFWQSATLGLPTMPAGKGSDVLPGGLGQLEYPMMLAYLRSLRAYLYTGTRPASYTLGLIEAMLSGVPVVSIGAHAWGDDWGGADLFETFTPYHADDPRQAHELLTSILTQQDIAVRLSQEMRDVAIATFGIETIGAQWRAFLG